MQDLFSFMRGSAICDILFLFVSYSYPTGGLALAIPTPGRREIPPSLQGLGSGDGNLVSACLGAWHSVVGAQFTRVFRLSHNSTDYDAGEDNN